MAVRLALCALAVILSISTRAELRAQDGGDGAPAVNDTLVYVGTYTGPASKGIYLFKLQTKNLEVSQNILLVPLGLAAETPSPSFLAVDPVRRLMFAVNEVDEFDGQKGGSVTSFRIDPATGKLAELSRRSTKGEGPCHLALDHEGKHVIAANYGGGSVAVLPVDGDGKLGDATDFVQHAGHGPNPQRQEGPHAHCVTMSPDGKFVFVCDLGLDQVLAYRYDGETGKLTPNDPAFTALAPGAGPRHMVFHPSGKFAYVVNELNSTVTAFAYDPEKGALRELQTSSTLPGYFDGPNTTAEIGVNPSGKFLYVSNRGHESVVLFNVNQDEGTLTYVEEQGTGGKTPRHFGIQPSGDHLVIANQNTNTLLICRIDDGNGRLKPSGVFADCPSPVCVVFLPPRKGDK
jgi:6-phosphogluconolactonase